MSKDYNEWEAKSIESELDKIRAKYLMSPSDFEKSSSMKHPTVNYTGTFKQEKQSSIDTRNQSLDNYGNEIREFVIDHPFKNQMQTMSSKRQSSSFSGQANSSQSHEDKENLNTIQEPQIIIEKPLPKSSYKRHIAEHYDPNNRIEIKTEARYTPKGYSGW